MKFQRRLSKLTILVLALMLLSGNTAWAYAPPSTLSPPPPTNVQASDGSYSYTIRITWFPSPGANSYRVFRSLTVDGNKTSLANTTATEYNDYEPGPLQVRYYWVLACVDNASCSGYSDYDSGFRGLATPTVYATDGTYTDKVRITWNPVQGATSYTLYRGTTSAGYDVSVSNITTTSYDNTSAVPGTVYYYWVRAFSTSPADQSSDGEDTGYRMYPPPTGVSASDGAYTDRVRVTWNAVAGTGRYQVWRIPQSGGDLVRVALTTDTVAHDTLATPGVRYEYRVWACNTSDTICGNYATDIGFRGLSAPVGVSATDGTYTDKVRITWNASTGAAWYNVRRGTSPGIYEPLASNIAGTAHDDTSATPGVPYYYVIEACNSVDCSALSASDSGYRNFAAPTGVQASDGTYADKVRVTWGASTGATHYHIERATSPLGTRTIIAAPAATAYDDTSTVLGALYYYWIYACNNDYCSAPSVADSGYRAQSTSTPTPTLTRTATSTRASTATATRTPTTTRTPTRTATATATATRRATSTPGPSPTRVSGAQRRLFLPLVMK